MLQFLVRSLNGYDVVHPDKFELHTLIFVFFFSVNYLFRLTNYPVTKTQINFSITKNISYWEQLFPLHILLFRLPTFMKFLFCQLTKSKTLAPPPDCTHTHPKSSKHLCRQSVLHRPHPHPIVDSFCCCF